MGFGSINSILMNSEDVSSESSSLLANASIPLRNVPHATNSIDELTFSQKLAYYIPCYNWMSEYKWSYLPLDIIAGLSLASYQIPLSMSFATALAHLPTSSGLLGLTIGPIVYTLLGSVPQMIVGPEAAVSMIIGQSIERVMKHHPDVDPLNVLCAIVFLSGLVLLTFGFLRFGFIANVLSATLLKGFITAIGMSMIVNSAISILGLTSVMNNLPPDVHVHTTIEKIKFLFDSINQYHKQTTIVGFSSFFTLLILRSVKQKLVTKHKSLQYFPEILFVVLAATFLSEFLNFNDKGIDVVGKVSLDGFEMKNPFSSDVRIWWGEMFPVSFVCAILGFFETSTAANSLSSNLKMPVSYNRELVSIGACGFAVSYFGALTSFGGYARSKLNAMIGAKSPLAGFVMGITTLFVTLKLLDYIYYLPLCVLNSVICIVGYKMVEETPKELKFHIRTKGWNEIITFFVTLIASMVYSIEIGVGMGCFYSLMRVIKHSTQSRVQILARVAGTDTFVNSDVDKSENTTFFRFPQKLVIKGYKEYRRQSVPTFDSSKLLKRDSTVEENVFPELEDREGCLFVRIAEPLTFFNANDMRARLKRIELYGSAHGHPASPKRDPPTLRHVVFDLEGMTSIDSCATAILHTIIDNYQRRGVNVFFCHVVKSKKLVQRLKDSRIKDLLELVEGVEFGINQSIPPYYDEILDALKAIDAIDSSCEWESRSYFSRCDDENV
ncbi:hypothetical protein DAMA08_009180 [Martiniozyma asiatica (nom. inval.)]|nr:hypothetical protein DAMA08_009180 [Martiniozyma asiatica]